MITNVMKKEQYEQLAEIIADTLEADWAKNSFDAHRAFKILAMRLAARNQNMDMEKFLVAATMSMDFHPSEVRNAK